MTGSTTGKGNDRQERLAQALRENLRRRKAQIAARRQADGDKENAKSTPESKQKQ